MARFEGQISLTQLGYGQEEFGKICGAIIGRGGSGIKQLTSKFPGLFVKLYDSRRGVGVRAPAKECDTIHISARQGSDVQAVAKQIAATARGVVDGTLSRGPQLVVGCPEEAVGFVIGRGGSGLQRIGQLAGNDCHIHYSRENGTFQITATTQQACDRARIYIQRAISDSRRPSKVVEVADTGCRPRSNAFDGLDVDGDDSGGEESSSIREHINKMEAAVLAGQEALEAGSRDSHDSISSRKSRELSQSKRWEIREWLSQQTDPATGQPQFPEFTRNDRKTGRPQKVTGVQAVPWSAVDDYIASKQKVAEQLATAKRQERAMALAEKRSYEARAALVANRTNDEIFPQLSATRQPTMGAWGSKPKSIRSADGVDQLNKVARKPRLVPMRRRAAKPTSGPIKMDLANLTLAPKTLQVDLTKALLPTPPAHHVSQSLPIADWDDAQYWDDFAESEGLYTGDWNDDEY